MKSYRITKVIRFYPDGDSIAGMKFNGGIEVEEFRYPGVLFMSDGDKDCKTYCCLGALDAVMHASHQY